MAQDKKLPAFRVSFIPKGENANWREIGALWETKNDKLHIGEIMVPIAAIATGSIRIAIQAIEE